MNSFSADHIDEAADCVSDLVRSARSIVFFTGAGISTESGIPDFRSPGGVWAKNRTVYFDDFLRSAEERYEYWRQKAIAHSDFAAAVPNITHNTVAQWEQSGRARGVITQNIDGLHQVAGSRSVLELHGTARKVGCLDCDWIDAADPWVEAFLRDDKVPACPTCGGRLKHATISFGQSLPADVLTEARLWAEESDLFFALGSSLVVEPAASLPRIARHGGGRLVIINRDATPLDAIADVVINAGLGQFFEAVNRRLAE